MPSSCVLRKYLQRSIVMTKSANYGNVINISVPYNFCGVVSDSNGLVVCEVDQWAEKFVENFKGGKIVDLQIDMETGAVLNWTPITRDQIVDLIDKSGQ